MTEIDFQWLAVWVLIAVAVCVVARRFASSVRGESSGCHACPNSKKPGRDFVPIEQLGMFDRDQSA